MTKSVRSINVVVRLDIQGYNLNDDAINDVINNMVYNFIYDNYYAQILNYKIIDTYIPTPNN